MNIPTKSIQQKAIKKTVDGIIDVLLRMYKAQENYTKFEGFCQAVLNMTPDEFYKADILDREQYSALDN